MDINPKPPSTEVVQRRLDKVLGYSRYKLVQINGQRKMFDPVNNYKFSPPEGCELFIGRLPRDLHEDELVPPFLRVGPIYELRLMMNFSGTTRGFAFVQYHDHETAERAMRLLDNFEIRNGQFIGVVPSVNNRRLFIEGIKVGDFNGYVREYLLTWLQKVTNGVLEVITYPPRNSVCAVVVYRTHRDAAMARRLLIPIKNDLFGRSVMIDWADPRLDHRRRSY